MNPIKSLAAFPLLLLFLLTDGKAQNLYDINSITEIEVTFATASWDTILDQYYANDLDERLLATVKINGVTYDSCGVKYKGNSTYSAGNAKNPLNIKLDYVINQDYQGWETIKLSNGKNDPSFVREVLSYEIARKYMDAPLSNYARVYINGNYYGLFSSSESIDGDFGERYLYADGDNTRFKCNPEYGSGSPSLEYLGTDSSLYYTSYELKSDFGWQDMIDLTWTITNQPDSIENLMMIDRAIWMLAFDNVLVNLDSYIGPLQQNYYLVKGDHGRMMSIIWDLNESLGGFERINNGPGPPPATNDLIQLDPFIRQGSADWPLVKMILADSTYMRMYIAHCRTILNENFASGWYKTEASALQNIIGNDVLNDPNAFYSYSEFVSNINNTVGTGPTSAVGVTQLMDSRVSYLQNHYAYNYTIPVISSVSPSVSGAQPYDTVFITASVTNANHVLLGYRLSQNQVFTKIEMYDDGNHQDGVAGDGTWGASVITGTEDVQYYVYAENADAGMFSPERAEHEFYTLTVQFTAGDLVINEFQASNSLTVFDQNGEYDDWIELYNNSGSAISLNGYFLSDDSGNLMRWMFPDTSIAGNSYLLIWADGDTLQQGLHTDFKLSASGEAIYLSDGSGMMIDQVVFGMQQTDSSMSRCANGSGNFAVTPPTPAQVNNCGAIGIFEEEYANEFIIYPNPAQHHIYIRTSDKYEQELEVFDVMGKRMTAVVLKDGFLELDVQGWANGIYFIRMENGESGKFIVSK